MLVRDWKKNKPLSTDSDATAKNTKTCMKTGEASGAVLIPRDTLTGTSHISRCNHKPARRWKKSTSLCKKRQTAATGSRTQQPRGAPGVAAVLAFSVTRGLGTVLEHPFVIPDTRLWYQTCFNQYSFHLLSLMSPFASPQTACEVNQSSSLF